MPNPQTHQASAKADSKHRRTLTRSNEHFKKALKARNGSAQDDSAQDDPDRLVAASGDGLPDDGYRRD